MSVLPHPLFSQNSLNAQTITFLILFKFRNRVVPFVYCLIPNKSEEIYKRALTCVLNSIGERRPMMFIIDFEKSVENVIRALIPQTHVAGCCQYGNQSKILA
ncbi:unnamed protein product [Meloidogyne enterolobii]|uniref:Uncharacterized protein n=1 Tax=Meloidogyne enterolobii TaxID=390850 RepID=A0ACB0ZJJ2_MELEN